MKLPKTKSKKSVYILVSAAVVLLGAGVVSYAIYAKSNANPDTSPIKTSSGKDATPTDDVPSSSDNNSSGSSSNTKPGSGQSSQSPTINSGVQPAAPTGTFVSNHQPNLSGQPRPNTLSSVCTTTPGTYCTILFTKGGVEKSLPAQKTDSDGNTTWSWMLQDIGLTEGTWSVTAIATNGDKVAQASDPTPLTVKK